MKPGIILKLICPRAPDMKCFVARAVRREPKPRFRRHMAPGASRLDDVLIRAINIVLESGTFQCYMP